MIDSDVCERQKLDLEFSCLKDDEMHVGGKKRERMRGMPEEKHMFNAY